MIPFFLSRIPPQFNPLSHFDLDAYDYGDGKGKNFAEILVTKWPATESRHLIPFTIGSIVTYGKSEKKAIILGIISTVNHNDRNILISPLAADLTLDLKSKPNTMKHSELVLVLTKDNVPEVSNYGRGFLLKKMKEHFFPKEKEEKSDEKGESLPEGDDLDDDGETGTPRRSSRAKNPIFLNSTPKSPLIPTTPVTKNNGKKSPKTPKRRNSELDLSEEDASPAKKARTSEAEEIQRLKKALEKSEKAREKAASELVITNNRERETQKPLDAIEAKLLAVSKPSLSEPPLQKKLSKPKSSKVPSEAEEESPPEDDAMEVEQPFNPFRGYPTSFHGGGAPTIIYGGTYFGTIPSFNSPPASNPYSQFPGKRSSPSATIQQFECSCGYKTDRNLPKCLRCKKKLPSKTHR